MPTPLKPSQQSKVRKLINEEVVDTIFRSVHFLASGRHADPLGDRPAVTVVGFIGARKGDK